MRLLQAIFERITKIEFVGMTRYESDLMGQTSSFCRLIDEEER